MIRIAVVEDELTIRESICERLHTYIHTECPYDIHTFDSAEQMLEAVRKGYVYQIVFSDIEMQEMNGIGLGVKLKEQNPLVYLVYLTSHASFAVDSYCLDAYQYILKNQMDERLPGIVGKLIQKMERDLNNFIILGTATGKKKVYYSDIIYIHKKKTSKYIEITTLQDSYYERETIRNVLEKLHSKEFVELGRGCVVNMRYIEGINDNIIKMIRNIEFDVSRARITKVKEQINRYWGEY